MIKAFTLISRRSDLDHEAFSAYWRDIHAGVVMSLVETRPLRYLQNHLADAISVYPGRRAVDGIAESWRASLEALPKPLHRNPRWLEVVRPDELRFIDIAGTANIVAEEAVLLDRPATAWKLLVFCPGGDADRPSRAVRHVCNRPLPDRQRMLDDAIPPLEFSSIHEFWFESRATLEAGSEQLAHAGGDIVVRALEHLVHDSRHTGTGVDG